ncbi:biliverdin-producing heme oxygenase [Solirubrobacter taibaiensis]|nr:biliverdin-producing heme oxygenase [Solirubrobacter taibaiensis]
MRALKAATAAHHDRLERLVDIEARVGTRDAYLELLERFYGFYRPLEAALAPYAGPFGPRHPLLAADIVAVGGDVDALPLAPRLPTVGTLHDALGVLYVLEGAALGGAVIGRIVRRELGLTSAFFHNHGIAPRWRMFGEHVERHAPVSERAAVATFEDMEVWLCGDARLTARVAASSRPEGSDSRVLGGRRV